MPVIDGPTEIRVTVLKRFNTTISVHDSDGDTVSVTTTLPDGATYDVSTGLFVWTPQDMSEIELR